MSTLAHWQTALTTTIDADGSSVEVFADTAVVPGPSVQQGCMVYRNSSRGARVDALADVYRVCQRLLGEESFHGLAREFVRRTPSRQGDLNLFGANFCDLIAEVVGEHAAFADLHWLPDLVRLEWLCHSVYYRADDPPLDLTPLHSGDPSQLIPRPAQRIAWMRSPWPVHEIWELQRQDGEPPELAIDRGDWFLVVERHAFLSKVTPVDAGLWILLDSCGRGLSLEEIGSVAGQEVTRLGELVQRQWIAALGSSSDAV